MGEASNSERVKKHLGRDIRLVQRPDQHWECRIDEVEYETAGPTSYKAYQIGRDPLEALMGATDTLERREQWEGVKVVRPMWEGEAG